MTDLTAYVLFSLVALIGCLVVILALGSKIAKQNDELDTLGDELRDLRDRIHIGQMQEGKR